MSDIFPNLEAGPVEDVFPLVAVRAGMRCLIHSLGDMLRKQTRVFGGRVGAGSGSAGRIGL
ncbi:MAG: hypothetical protein GYB27_23875 [Rhodobacteraceae bacterium]|nr:hypothetical protein [Paracoccaceae bacterium]